MSIDRCAKCGDLVDTDANPDAYVEIGNMRAQTEFICYCPECRAIYEDQIERQRTEPPGLDDFIARMEAQRATEGEDNDD